LIHSVDFARIEAMQRAGDWRAAARLLAEAAQGLRRAGAGVLILATNTMHIVFDELVDSTDVPWIHIADATGAAMAADGIARAGLLGTRFSMERSFYADRLSDRYGIDIAVPEEPSRAEIDRIIFDELVHGTIRAASRDRFRAIIEELTAAGAEAIILGCTEIGLLIGVDDAAVPLYDTAKLHAQAAVDWLSADADPR
jgi:aspartate racemase